MSASNGLKMHNMAISRLKEEAALKKRSSCSVQCTTSSKKYVAGGSAASAGEAAASAKAHLGNTCNQLVIWRQKKIESSYNESLEISNQ